MFSEPEELYSWSSRLLRKRTLGFIAIYEFSLIALRESGELLSPPKIVEETAR
jgi:hypothetical protein